MIEQVADGDGVGLDDDRLDGELQDDLLSILGNVSGCGWGRKYGQEVNRNWIEEYHCCHFEVPVPE